MALCSNLAGLVLSPPLSEMPELLREINRVNLPFVGVVSEACPKHCAGRWVCVDDRQAAREIVSHLIQQGHQRIGFIAGNRSHRSTQQREQGYLDALSSHQLPRFDDLIIDGNYSFQSGIDGASRLLRMALPPTAIFACNGGIAPGALSGALLQAYTVPDDLAVARFEDSSFAMQAWQPLTTALQNNNTIAYRAGYMLIEGIRGGRELSAAARSDVWYYCPKMVVRNSPMKKPG